MKKSSYESPLVRVAPNDLEAMSVHTASSTGVRSLMDDYYDEDEHDESDTSDENYGDNENDNSNNHIHMGIERQGYNINSSNIRDRSYYNNLKHQMKAHGGKHKILSPLHEQGQSIVQQNTYRTMASSLSSSSLQKENKFPNKSKDENGSISEKRSANDDSRFDYLINPTITASEADTVDQVENRPIQQIHRQNTFDSISTFHSETSASTSAFNPLRSSANQNQQKEQHRQHQHQQQALVLDPSNTTSFESNDNNEFLTMHPTSSNHSVHSNFQKNPKLKNILNNVQMQRSRIIMGISSSIGASTLPISTSSISSNMSNNTSSAPTDDIQLITASAFAKTAPHAGYLCKLGGSINEYKRRFFVLKPTTCLYYFLSPNDTEPRGCIDLDDGGCLLPDEEFMLGEKSKDGEDIEKKQKNHTGMLQVNSLETLPDGRFRFEIVLPSKKNDKKRRVVLEARNEQVGKEWMAFITKERLSYSKYEKLELLRRIENLENENKDLERRLEECRLFEKDRDSALKAAKELQQKLDNHEKALCVLKRWMSRPPDDKDKELQVDSDIKSDVINDGYQDSMSFSVDDNDLQNEELQHPHGFASLANVCRGVRETLRLTAQEANIVVGDLNKANEKINALSSRMVKAEKYLCKLWDENRSIRDDLKKKKAEKKVLVSEVIALREKGNQYQEIIENLKKENNELLRLSDTHTNASLSLEDQPMQAVASKRRPTVAQKKAIRDLYDHIYDEVDSFMCNLPDFAVPNNDKELSSIIEEKDSNQCQSEISTPTVSNAGVKNSACKDFLPHTLFEPRDENSSDSDHSEINVDTVKRAFSPLRPKSLLDEIALKEQKGQCPIIKNDDFATTNDAPTLSESNDLDLSELIHPLNKIDNDDSITEPSELSLKSLVTDNVEATSTLSCPLIDVKQGRVAQDSRSFYHLTFYSSKIGLQFQKVPNDVSNNGILTDAMTVSDNLDVGVSATASSRNEAELKLIASMHNKESSREKPISQDYISPVVFPEDIVLVCGFNGFDETSNSNKPSLGARLIAFNGISIERGPWTFDTVRKAIKGCDRPLTLSFRDDFLTTNQRIILTKAAAEVAGVHPKYHIPIQNVPKIQQGIPRFINAKKQEITGRISRISSEQDMINEEYGNTNYENDNESGSMSTAEMKSQSSETWKTFSDTGSSSVFSTKFAPMMAGLIANMKEDHQKQQPNFTPEYFHRDPDYNDSIPNLQEFKAGLL